MSLSPEQKQAVAAWVAAGDNLSSIQKKLADEFKVSMTYRDVRFLVDDLDLTLKDAAPKADTSDLSKAPPPAKSSPDKTKETLGQEDAEDGALPPEDEFADEDAVPASGRVSVSVDKVTLIPGAIASGTVTFSDGVTGKWIVDNYGRPGFTDISQPGYRPNPTDAQEFMQELSQALQSRGM